VNGRTGLRLSPIRFSEFPHLRRRFVARRDLDRRESTSGSRTADSLSLRHIPSLPVHVNRIESEGDRLSPHARSACMGDVLHVKNNRGGFRVELFACPWMRIARRLRNISTRDRNMMPV